MPCFVCKTTEAIVAAEGSRAGTKQAYDRAANDEVDGFASDYAGLFSCGGGAKAQS